MLCRAIKLGEFAYYEWLNRSELSKVKTWVLFGKTDKGNQCGVSLFRLVKPFRFRLSEGNPYLRGDDRKTITSRYKDVAIIVARTTDVYKLARVISCKI